MNRPQSAPMRQVSAGPSGRTAAVVLVVAVLVAMLAVPVRSWFLQQARIADAESKLATVQDGVAELTQQQQRWRDEHVVEREARIRLNYVFPGEVGIVVLAPQQGTVAAAAPPQTWFEGLRRSVDAASGREQTDLGEVQTRPTAPR